MPGSLTLLSGLPKYEVFLEEAKRYPGLDATACYAYLQLLRTGDELLALDEQILNSYGTRHGRFNLLMMLAKCHHGDATPASLAEKTGVTRATISGLLDGLEKDGMIVRRPDPQDRRLIRINLTAEGKSFVDGTLPGYTRWLSSIVEPLNAEERQHLVTLLEKIRTRISELVAINETAKL